MTKVWKKPEEEFKTEGKKGGVSEDALTRAL